MTEEELKKIMDEIKPEKLNSIMENVEIMKKASNIKDEDAKNSIEFLFRHFFIITETLMELIARFERVVQILRKGDEKHSEH